MQKEPIDTLTLETNSVVALAARLRTGYLTSAQLCALYRERIARIDPGLHAFVELAQAWDKAGDGPTASAVGGVPSPLCGLPFGVKDVIDVAGLHTRAGSRSRDGIVPASNDADVVASLRQAGLVPLGKTATTEFAFVDPAPTRNPHNLDYSPGGSSSGSAAAVAAALIPFAFGTQTAGSLCRPAAYCGISAIKPSRGLLSTRGVTPLAQRFDTVGVLARGVADAAVIIDTLCSGFHPRRFPPVKQKQAIGPLGVLSERFYRNSSAQVGAFHEEMLRTVTATGTPIATIDPDVDFAAVVADHRLVMLYEAYRNHHRLLAGDAEVLGPRFRAALHEGGTIDLATMQSALQRLDRASATFWNACEGIAGLLLQPAPAVAPRGLSSTGDQSYQTPLTVFGGPLVVVPGRYDAGGLPLAAMIAAAPGQDATAVEIGCWLQERIDQLPDYVTPRPIC